MFAFVLISITESGTGIITPALTLMLHASVQAAADALEGYRAIASAFESEEVVISSPVVLLTPTLAPTLQVIISITRTLTLTQLRAVISRL